VELRSIAISQSTDPKFTIDVTYPSIASASPDSAVSAINTAMSSAASRSVAAFQHLLTAYPPSTASEFNADLSTLTGSTDSDLLNGDVAAFTLNVYQYEAGARTA
jgi:hypothetical protein